MQTIHVSEQKSNLLSQIGTFLGIGAAVVLFAVVIVRMGFFNRVLNTAEMPALSTVEAAVLQSLTLTTKDMAFGPTEMRVKAGEPVTLQLDNYDFYGHSFDIDAFDLHVAMPGNGRATATFTPTEPGEYTIYCSVPGHREAGMIGTLIVEP
ncbi:MAG: cupredoxin domain-containing protein [Anaerolineales bacterium]|nr:cupredoxin domain-containing protein [Anaerolineales bacterium]MCA9929996.1 cupredoxin domain-containing protein [Anaerolineales bacterium]